MQKRSPKSPLSSDGADPRLYLSERSPFLVWLLPVTRHTALDRLRLEARRPLLSDSRDPDTIWPSLPDMYENTDEALWRSLYLAVHSLPEQQRQVLELTYYQGMSHSEIAKELG